MKKFILVILCALFTLTVSAQDYKYEGRENKWEQTPFTYEHSDGKIYQVLINKDNGRCAVEVQRVSGPNSKNPGKVYQAKVYLSETQSKDVCRKLGRTYSYKKKERK